VSLLPAPHLNLEEKYIDTIKYFYWDKVRNKGEQTAFLSLKVDECEIPSINKSNISICIKFEENQITIFPDYINNPIYCIAYGANRPVAESSLGNYSFENISETLFKDDAFLQNSSEYLLRLDYETAKSRKGSDELRKLKELLLRVLPEGVQDIKIVKTGKLQREVQVKTGYGWVNLNDLSLGYKTTIAWLIDFATKMIYFHEKSEDPFNEPAILVLDEIDLHMHPAWQREIIENLTKIFPKTQFIVTAHSPLIVQSAFNSNLVLLKKKGDSVEIINEPDVVSSWRIDQVLTSDLFGLKNSRGKKTEELLARRRELILKDALTDEEKDELDKLESKMDEIPVAETPEYIKAIELVLKMSKAAK
jgi:hypothetical protein